MNALPRQHPRPRQLRPRVWRFADLDTAYTDVQCNDSIRDGDVVVSDNDATGLTIGFVYETAWVATTYSEVPSAHWERLDDIDATLRDKPRYRASVTLARRVEVSELAARCRRDVQEVVADSGDSVSETTLRALVAVSNDEVNANLHDWDYADAFTVAEEAAKLRALHLEHLRTAARVAIAHVRAQSVGDIRSDTEILAEIRWGFATITDSLTAAYRLVQIAPNGDLAELGWPLVGRDDPRR